MNAQLVGPTVFADGTLPHQCGGRCEMGHCVCLDPVSLSRHAVTALMEEPDSAGFPRLTVARCGDEPHGGS